MTMLLICNTIYKAFPTGLCIMSFLSNLSEVWESSYLSQAQ